ncbi:FabD/lysophospholipase-like protein [Ceratobasidium sp. AG-I]|nr:FabD/lysophospholipase-like protein [Ceratobasidium sp. AG-I]
MPAAKWYLKKREGRRKSSFDGLRILSIDGGGARGLSALVILESLMKRVQQKEGLAATPDPDDYFDLMGGTGTGGIAVAMLGRLGMSTSRAIETHGKLSEVFADRKLLSSGTNVFKASKLESALKAMVEEATGNPEEHMMDERTNGERCKIMVFARSKHSLNAGIPCIFRSYDAPSNRGPNCTIWQALRATTAHPDLFKSIEISELNIQESFVDGGLGCNNPLPHILAEAKALYPNRKISTIVSIGTGHVHTIYIPDSRRLGGLLPKNVVAAMKGIAMDSEQVAREMGLRFQCTWEVYFRFSVDQGMQDIAVDGWESLGAITAHTRAYMQQVQCNQALDKAAQSLQAGNGVISTSYADGSIQVDVPKIATMWLCPSSSHVFTGRREPIAMLTACLVHQTQHRRVFVLHGLGGAGKTQIALRFIEESRYHWSDVLFIDATSRETIINSLQAIASAKKIGDKHTDTLSWLSNNLVPWLMVFDNADNPELGIEEFFPNCMQGNILITSRLRDMALISQGPKSNYCVSGMGPDEARDLLVKSAKMEDQELSYIEQIAVSAIVEDFEYLALAIVHAGAYIYKSELEFSQYREIYHEQKQTLLEEYENMPIKVDGYQRTVHATWIMSYNRLTENAQQLLWLFSCLHRVGISVEIFRRASETVDSYTPPVPPTDIESMAQLQVKKYLGLFSGSDNIWNEKAFLSVTNELVSLSLITRNRASRTYALHPLVHVWAGTVVPDRIQALERAAFLLAMSVSSGAQSKDISFRQSLEPHVDEILRQSVSVNSNNAEHFARVYRASSRLSEAEVLTELVMSTRKSTLGDQHPLVLASMYEHAVTYSRQARWDYAEKILTQLVAISKQTLGEESQDTLNGMHELSCVYMQQGRLKESEQLVEDLLATRRRVLGEGHPQTLETMPPLAIIYFMQGRLEEAEDLCERASRGYDNLPAEGDIQKLLMLAVIASIYSQRNQLDKAEALQLQLLGAHKRLLGQEHYNTVIYSQHLASTYHKQGRLQDAEALQMEAIDTMKKMLDKIHPSTLMGMKMLADLQFKQRKRKDLGEWGDLEGEGEAGFLERFRLTEELMDWSPPFWSGMSNVNPRILWRS